MANDNLKILGFYVPIGSSDYAKSWNVDQAFGFDEVEGVLTGPVFNKTLFDIENAFQYPITINKRMSTIVPQNAIIGLNNFVSRMIYQKEILPKNVVDTIPLPGSTEYNDLMNVVNILDYIWTKPEKNVSALTSEDVAILDPVGQYLFGSLGPNWPTKINMYKYTGELPNAGKWGHRYSYVEIRDVPLGADNNTPNPQLYDFKIYFIPDAFYENETNTLDKRVKVYYYEDMDGDPIISPEEWRERIIFPQHKIFEDVKYKKRPASFPTRYFPYWDPSLKSGGDNEWPDSNLIPSMSEFFYRYFYVYSLYDAVDGKNGVVTEFPFWEGGSIEHYIKDHLINEVRPDGKPRFNLLELQNMYPDLFLSSDLAVFFVKSKGWYMHPISLEKMRAVLISQGFAIGGLNFNNAEIVTVGSEDDPVNVLEEPMTAVAVNQRKDSADGPISDMFNYFVPIFTNEINFPADVNAMREEQVRDFHRALRVAALTFAHNKIPSDAVDTAKDLIGTKWVRNFNYMNDAVSFSFTAQKISGGGALAGVSVIIRTVDVQ